MSGDTLNSIAHRVVAELDPSIATLVVWHAGEPTTVRLDWYRSAYEMLGARKRGKPLTFSVQTNGIGLDDAFAGFLAETGTTVGLSLDGPEEIHDLHRKTNGGRGTWRQVMRGLEVLRRNGIEPGIISVLTAESLGRADEMLAFFQAHGLHSVSFSVEEREGANTTSSLDIPGVEASMEAFLLRFMRGIAHAGAPIHLRDAERILGLLASGTSNVGENEQTVALAALTVDWQGGVYTFSPEFSEHASGNWSHACLGNINTHTLSEIVNSPELSRLSGEVSAGLEACARQCEFWEICGGGSPVNRLAEHGSLAIAETQFCRLTVQATARALRKLLAVTKMDQIGVV